MEYKSFLIKYGEIGVKGKNRYKFEDALVRQLGLALKPLGTAFHIVKEHGRIYVDMDGAYDYEDTIAALQRVFGVVSICPVLRLTERGEDAIAAEAVRFLREITAGQRVSKSLRVALTRTTRVLPRKSAHRSARCCWMPARICMSMSEIPRFD